MAKRNIPFKLYFNKDNYELSLKYYEDLKPYFQKIVNKFNTLKIEYKLQKNDLLQLCTDTKNFLTEKIMNGENLQVGGLSLSKEKLFDLIEAPEIYLDFIQFIQKEKNEINHFVDRNEFVLNSSSYFEINNDVVETKKEIIDNNKNNNTILIDTKEKLEALELLEQIAENVTKLTNMKPHFQTMQTLEQYFIYDHYKINEKDSVIKVNPKVFQNFF